MLTRARPSPFGSVRTSLYASKSGKPTVPPVTNRMLPQIVFEFTTVKSVVLPELSTHGEFSVPVESHGSFSAID